MIPNCAKMLSRHLYCTRPKGHKGSCEFDPCVPKPKGSKVIRVPDIPHPTLCFKQKLTPPNVMTRCTYKKGHKGLHSWGLE